LSVTDSGMGTWTYTPDSLNRLNTATATAGPFPGLTLTETYDVFGTNAYRASATGVSVDV
jgi:hypothetical protein